MRRKRALPRRIGVLVVTLLILASGSAAAAPSAAALSSTVVISQVYGGGGQAGAPYLNDFVELFNRGTSTVSLTGWSIQYASATGTGTFASNPVTALSGSLAPGQYYLVRMASAGAVGAPLPTPDATGTVNMAAAGAKVVLASTTTGLACNGGSVPCTPAQLAVMVDLIGWGAANFYEGVVGPTTSVTTAALRGGGGHTETDNNASDFSTGAPNPRTTASPLNILPTITQQPTDQTVIDGQPATFSAAASGSPAPSVRWQRSTDGGTAWSDIPGATSTTLTFTATAPQSGHRYRAAFTNSAGATVFTNAAVLTVNVPPAITQQPTDQTVIDGQPATFSAAASGSPAPSVTWQESSDGGATWSDIPGATSTTLTFTATAPQSGYRYRAAFTNSAATVSTNAAVLTVDPPPVVISQVYGGGGNIGATLTNDFVELFNRGTTTVSLNGWSVQYAATTGVNWSRTDLSGTIAPGQYYLIQQWQGAGGTTSLPTPDAIGTIAMHQERGKVVLVASRTTIPVGTVQPAGPSIIDVVGYGSGTNCFEGSGPAPTLSNTTAALRNGEGWVDTDDNASDFSVGPPNPRTTASPLNPGAPTAVITVPPDGQTLTGTTATISGTASDLGGAVVSVAVSIQRSGDGAYWTGSAWSSTETWLDATGTATWTYDWTFDPASQDGSPSYTIVARATDTMRYTGTATVTGVTVDNVAPTGAGISIDGGAPSAASREVTLTLAATGATRMRFSNDGSTWTDWEPYAVSRSWTLTDGDGEKTVYVEFADAAGNTAGADDGIILDTTAPTGVGISINGGAAYATRPKVTLTLAATGATRMRFSNDGVNWTDWEPYAGSKSWMLSPGSGPKTVYVQFSDAAGNTSGAHDTVHLYVATIVGAGISIDGGATYATSREVTLTLVAPGATRMRFSNDGSTWSEWEPYAARKSWTLTDGDGEKTVYVQFADAAGHWVGVDDGIILDTTAPTGVGISINGGAAYATGREVTLTLAATGATRMRFSNDGASWSAWEPYAARKSWTLTDGDGEKTVFVQFADAAGNRVGVDDSIVLDTTAPSGSARIAGGAVAVNRRAVVLDVGATGATRMRFSNNGTTWSAWEPYAVRKRWTLTAGDGEKTVYVQFADAAGHWVGVDDGIILDTRRPTPTAGKAVSASRGAKATLRYRIKDPAPNAGTATVRIVVRTLDGTKVKTATIKNRPVAKALKYRFVCKLQKGSYQVVFRATDAAGNRQTKVARATLTVK
jgi:hypothetical protein